MMMNPRTILVSFVLLALVMQTVGCIDIYMLKDLSIKPETVEVKYGWVQKMEVKKDFYLNITDNEVKAARFLYTDGFNVTEGSKRIQLQINIQLVDVTNIPSIPGLGDIIANLSEMLQNIKRHVSITLYTPQDEVFWMKTYNESIDDSINIPTPLVGNWRLDIDATGIGFKPYHDYLYVQLSVLEPKSEG